MVRMTKLMSLAAALGLFVTACGSSETSSSEAPMMGSFTPCPDADGDGFAVCSMGCALPAGKRCGDCDDTAAAIRPDAVEGPADAAVCSDHVDNNCNGLVDAADPGCAAATAPAPATCPDADKDGFAVCDPTCSPAYGTRCGDCNDADAAIHPGGVEGPADAAVCSDHVDNDCDGAVDAADRGCAATSACADADKDGFAACDGTCMPAMGTSCGDCDDTNAAVHPGAIEGPAGAPVCSDLIDNNCDGRIDAAAPGCATASMGADYDIMGFGAMCMATVGQPITLKVSVALNGTVDAGAKLTVSGVQDVNNAGTTKVSIPVVAAKPISGTNAYVFSYVPTQRGIISWTASVEDADADVDVATAMTNVR